MAACRFVQTALLVATVVCAAVFAQEETSAHWEALKTISHSNLDFTNSLYQVLSRREGNLFFSPSSIHIILALTSLGARGTTAQQMIEGLHLPTDQQQTKDGFRQLTNTLLTNTDVTLKVANKIYTDTRFPPTAEFALTAKNDFHSSSEVVDFAHKHEEARVNVNTWVEEHTEHKITNLLEEGTVRPETAMILVNAVYFKGNWENEFPTERTIPKPFYVSADVTKEVPMMHLTVSGNFGYRNSEFLNAEVLEIPYIGSKVSLVIILPKEKFGLKDVEAKMAQLTFSNLTSVMSHPQVHLSLPKFKLDESLDMTEILQEMGMWTMFEEQADFSGLAAGPIKVSTVAHKAFIDVSEEGTEAAASTVLVASWRSIRRLPRKNFNSDHPFIFALVNTEYISDNTKHTTVLFMGRYSHP